MELDGARATVRPRGLARLRPLGGWAALPFHWFHCRWQLIRPAWFSVLVVALLVAAFLNAQTRDVFVATAEDSFRAAMLFLGLLVFSLTAWYCARANLYVDYKFLADRQTSAQQWQWCPPLEPEEAEAWRCWVPRLLGVAAPICVGSVYLAHAWATGTFDRNALLGLASLFLAFGLYLGFILKRRIQERQDRRKRAEEDHRAAEQAPKLQAKLPSDTFRWLLVSLAVMVILILALVVAPLVRPELAALPVWLGSLSLFLFAAAFWMAVGSFVLVYPTYRFRLTPSLVLVAVLVAATFNLWPSRSGDHLVRGFCADSPLAVVLHRLFPGSDDCRDGRLAPDGQLATGFATWASGRPSIRDHLDRWLEARATAFAPATAERPYPVFVLAAEGGGIRAAYWTAAVLAELEDRLPGFACHVFAISGVSGGSLGAATYAGLIADKASRGEMPDCGRHWFRSPATDGTQSSAKSDLLFPRAAGMLDRDFLAPALAGLLYPDLVQRFLPVSLFPDRATYLEKAWEGAWVAAPGSDRRLGATCSDPDQASNGEKPPSPCNWMRGPFHALWHGEMATLVPSLFLNTTEVETGRRLIVSSLKLPVPANCDEEKRRSFGAATDAFAALDCPASAGGPKKAAIAQPIRLSTAAGLSARFTYVSPPARLHNGVRVVDGGYYENGGVLTAHDILREIEGSERYRSGKHKLRVVVVTLVNSTFEEEPEARQSGCDGREQALVARESGNDDWLAATFHETWAPVAALLGTRTARGKQAAVDLRAALPATLAAEGAAEHLHRLGLGRPGHRLGAYHHPGDSCGAGVRTFPLGWMLAPGTAEEMAIQAKDTVAASLTLHDRWLARYAAPAPIGAAAAPAGDEPGARTFAR